uniref:Uncharacterized protein n=1 Tax=Oryza punctata TaxID=4537 RepID=A0A0E0LRN7_ORYPU
MAERRLGRGRNAARRRWWWEDGRMSAATARRTARRPPFGWRVGGGEHAPAPDESLTRRQMEEAAEGDAGAVRRVGVVDLAIDPSAAWRGALLEWWRFGCGAAKPRVAAAPCIYRREAVHHSKPKQQVVSSSSSSSSVWLPLWALGRGPLALFTLQRASRRHKTSSKMKNNESLSPSILQSKDLLRSLTICFQMNVQYYLDIIHRFE